MTRIPSTRDWARKERVYSCAVDDAEILLHNADALKTLVVSRISQAVADQVMARIGPALDKAIEDTYAKKEETSCPASP